MLKSDLKGNIFLLPEMRL